MTEWLLLLTASLCTVLGIVFPVAWLLTPIGLALFLALLIYRTNSLREAIIYGGVYGFITGAGSITWFWEVLPLSWLGISDVATSVTAAGMTWLYIGFSLGIGVSLASVFIWMLRAHAWAPAIIPFIWLGAEEFRMWGFALFTWAPTSLFGPHFSPAMLGYALIEFPPFAYAAFPFGVHALTFLVAAIATSLVFLASSSRAKYTQAHIALVAVSLLLFVPSLVASPISSETTRRIAVITAPIKEGGDPTVIAPFAEEALSDERVDVLLFPESLPLSKVFPHDTSYGAALRRLSGDNDILVIHSHSVKNEEGFEVERLYYESTQTGVLTAYDKTFIIPLGEYLPSFAAFFYAGLTDPGLGNYFSYINTLGRGTTMPEPLTWNGVSYAALQCSELISPYLYQHMITHHDVDVLINIANQAWFHSSRTLAAKIEQIARTQAAATRRPLLLSGNDTPSLVIDMNGTVLQRSTWDTPDVLYADIPVLIDN